MNSVEKLQKRHEIGQPIFEEIFKLSSKEIKEKLCEIVGKEWFDRYCDGMIEKGSVTKVLVDDIPDKITIGFYDSIEIDWAGITFCPEHSVRVFLKIFDEHFKL